MHPPTSTCAQGGIATSLLFSTFESWVVAEHFARGYEGAWLSDLFSKAVFLGQGLMAIVAGLVANYFVDTLKMGPVAPFDLSLVVLAVRFTSRGTARYFFVFFCQQEPTTTHSEARLFQIVAK